MHACKHACIYACIYVCTVYTRVDAVYIGWQTKENTSNIVVLWPRSRSRSRSRSRDIYFSNASWRKMNNQSRGRRGLWQGQTTTHRTHRTHRALTATILFKSSCTSLASGHKTGTMWKWCGHCHGSRVWLFALLRNYGHGHGHGLYRLCADPGTTVPGRAFPEFHENSHGHGHGHSHGHGNSIYLFYRQRKSERPIANSRPQCPEWTLTLTVWAVHPGPSSDFTVKVPGRTSRAVLRLHGESPGPYISGRSQTSRRQFRTIYIYIYIYIYIWQK
jgi:hypothetical protein